MCALTLKYNIKIIISIKDWTTWNATQVLELGASPSVHHLACGLDVVWRQSEYGLWVWTDGRTDKRMNEIVPRGPGGSKNPPHYICNFGCWTIWEGGVCSRAMERQQHCSALKLTFWDGAGKSAKRQNIITDDWVQGCASLHDKRSSNRVQNLYLFSDSGKLQRA